MTAISMLISLTHAAKEIRFSEHDACLPILCRDGSIQWVQWGRRLRDQGNLLPIGRWIPLDEVKSDRWKGHGRVPVKVSASRYCMEADGIQYWYNVPPGMYLQGVVMRQSPDDLEQVAYLVTVPSSKEVLGVSETWPRLV